MDRQLLEVADARYLRDRRNVAALLEEEARLRKALQRLDEQARHAGGLPTVDSTMHIVGADLLWQGWLDRSRRATNMELARVLAQKEAVMTGVRLSFGRRQAIAEILVRYRADECQKADRKYYEDLTLWQNGSAN